MNMRLIGDRLSVELFRLAGVSGETPDTPEAVKGSIDTLLQDPDVGVILVTNSLAKKVGGEFRKYIERRKLPLVLRIPDRRDREGQITELREYLQRTLGIKL